MEEKNKSIESVLQLYAEVEEKTNNTNTVNDEQNEVRQPTQPEEVARRMRAALKETKSNKTMTPQELFALRASQSMDRPSMKDAHEIRLNEIRQEIVDSGLGFISIPIESLPTQGLFYPEGTKIYIRAATGGDLRHWSMTNEQELLEINEALDYIFERCVKISFPEGVSKANWKDVKEIDRLYLILAVRDITFTDGQNVLKISVSENNTVTVDKDNIQFIDLGEKIMRYYNPEQRCFTFESKNKLTGYLNFYLPSIGVTRWLKDYIQKKNQRQEDYDKDFITVAPILIKDYRALNDTSYRNMIINSMNFTNYEWALIAKVKKTIENAISPKMIYVDESGAEQETPLNFQGGIKSIFMENIDDIDL